MTKEEKYRKAVGKPVQSRRIRVGDQFVVNWHDGQGGVTLAELWTVTELTRTLIVISDGKGGEHRMIS